MQRRSFLGIGLGAAAAPVLAAGLKAMEPPRVWERDGVGRASGRAGATAAPWGETPAARARAATPVSRRADIFLSHRLGADHAEAVSVMDMNGDGRLDIVSGAYWYENPGPNGVAWKRHQWRYVSVWRFAIAGERKIEFVGDCIQFPVDVNHDGALDIVAAAWQTDGIWWYQNPRSGGTFWQPHLICHSRATEGGAWADINGDGMPEAIFAHYEPSSFIWINFASRQPEVHYAGGKTADGHGVGVADITGDGKPDILSIHGWLENLDANRDQWRWHPDWELGEAGFPILGYDVNGDGKMDVIYGHGHDFGLYWLEQQVSRGRRRWRRHLIDDSFSEAHALKLADIDGDGEPELITGKRYRGDPDPGIYEPLCIFYYKIDRRTGSFTRFPISYNGTAEIGTQVMVADMDGDGDQDIVVAGKTGVHWLENLRVNRVPAQIRERELWLNVNWPFRGESGPDSPAGHEAESGSILRCE